MIYLLPEFAMWLKVQAPQEERKINEDRHWGLENY
jgi:hypothetical protein